MSEPIPMQGHEGGYFNDNAQLFSDIMRNAGRLLDGGSVRLEFDMDSLEPTLTYGLPTANDFLDADPTITSEWAAQAAGIQQVTMIFAARTSLVALRGMIHMHELATEAQRLYDSGVAPDTPAAQEQLTEYTLTSLPTGSWRQVMGEDADGNAVTIAETKLSDVTGANYASGVELAIEDSLVKRTCAIIALRDEVQIAKSTVTPIADPLLERAVRTFGSEDLSKATFLMTGIDLTNTLNVDAELNDLRLNYQGTSKEQEVGPLLDEIRDRHFAAKDSLALRMSLGENGLPSFQELVELNNYLAEL